MLPFASLLLSFIRLPAEKTSLRVDQLTGRWLSKVSNEEAAKQTPAAKGAYDVAGTCPPYALNEGSSQRSLEIKTIGTSDHGLILRECGVTPEGTLGTLPRNRA